MISNLANMQTRTDSNANPDIAAAVRPLGASTRARRVDLVVIPGSQMSAILGGNCGNAIAANDHVSSFFAEWFAGYPTTTAKKDHSQRLRPT